MSKLYFANLNYVCNERCVFCAAGLADGPQINTSRPRGVTLEDVRTWTGGTPPDAGQNISLAGGEPTLHPDFLDIVRYLASEGARVTLFTNGLRMANERFAADSLAAGVSCVQIALFGASADTHDAVTQRAGSFERTLRALSVLDALHDKFDLLLEVRLLVSSHSNEENSKIVRLLAQKAIGADLISLNRLIRSENAAVANASISWETARSSINETAALVRHHGYALGFEALPLCVYDGDNLDFVLRELGSRIQGDAHEILYLDPFTAVGEAVKPPKTALALPNVCRECALVNVCGRVENWYVEEYGTSGLSNFPVS